MDIDFFKNINDTFGHLAGDETLIHLAKILKENVRVTDCVSRWGGEEFIIVATGTSQSDTSQFAEKLRKAVEEYNFPTVEKVTISCGVAEYSKGEDINDLITKVDTALYKAKDAGRNCVIDA